ncbi:phospho-N-acetylmuramoyl-pentapeptide-transferase [bacterium]|nr:phospho-N-acetylmuramoyl-pentapeptide-transferase [bacterium]
MFYHFLYPLHTYFIGFNVFRYITFRTIAALFTGMLIYFVFGKLFISYLCKKQFWQTLLEYVPIAHHTGKRQIPTMGGVLLWVSVFASTILWGKLDNVYVLLVMAVTFAMCLVGFLDDYRKVILKDAHGLRARFKFPLQVLVATMGMLFLFDGLHFDGHLTIPFFKEIFPQLGWWYIPFGIFVIVGAANAVNLTDGLDGLVTGPSIMAYLSYAVLAYLAGHIALADYLNIPYISGTGELTVFCGAVVGACIGFLWFNSHPAEIFMGDVGSLPLGAALGTIAIITKNELLLVIIGGIFVLETISVIVQVISYQLTGKRVFRMAPIHHHFELKGWPESKVIIRFWIIALILALVALSTLKLR